MEFIPVAPYRPDVARFDTGVGSLAQNVVPLNRTKTSQGDTITFGPVEDYSAFTSALPQRVQGAFGFTDSIKTPYVFVGTAEKLYSLESGNVAFDSATDVTAYATPLDSFWEFTSYGDRVIATNGVDPVQNLVTTTSSKFTPLSPDAPKAKHLATVREFIVLGNTQDSTYGVRPQRVWWSAVDDPTFWPDPVSTTAAQVQSGFVDRVGEWGDIQGIVPALTNADAAVIFERGVHRMTFSQFPATFSFDVVEGSKGTPSPQSIVRVENQVYYLGEDGFYAFDGLNIRAVGHAMIDRWFYSNLDENFIERVVGAYDPNAKLIYWAFPSTQSSNGNPDRILVFNYQIGEWSVINENTSFIFPSFTFAITLEQLDALYPTIEDVPFSLDSKIFAGGLEVITIFDHQNRLAYKAASTKEALVESAQFDTGSNFRGLVTNAGSMFEGETEDYRIGLFYRDRLNAPFLQCASVPPNANGFCALFRDSRYFKLRMRLLANASWTEIQGFRVEVQRSSEF